MCLFTNNATIQIAKGPICVFKVGVDCGDGIESYYYQFKYVYDVLERHRKRLNFYRLYRRDYVYAVDGGLHSFIHPPEFGWSNDLIYMATIPKGARYITGYFNNAPAIVSTSLVVHRKES